MSKEYKNISTQTNPNYNHQLEIQYLDLNDIERYVVDNYRKFEIGMALDLIHIDRYYSTIIAKKLRSICDCQRIRKKKYSKMIEDHTDLFVPTSITQYQVRVYTLKSKDELPDLYAIIEYKANNNA